MGNFADCMISAILDKSGFHYFYHYLTWQEPPSPPAKPLANSRILAIATGKIAVRTKNILSTSTYLLKITLFIY